MMPRGSVFVCILGVVSSRRTRAPIREEGISGLRFYCQPNLFLHLVTDMEEFLFTTLLQVFFSPFTVTGLPACWLCA